MGFLLIFNAFSLNSNKFPSFPHGSMSFQPKKMIFIYFYKSVKQVNESTLFAYNRKQEKTLKQFCQQFRVRIFGLGPVGGSRFTR